ncbi:MAG: hypothetical protein NTY81_01445 [Candidatus Staskawiczbacteria bacterium]|nr:hypothetical protein [Candidatus Staskawiczbacteria bacterium]
MEKINKFLYWTPRVSAVIFILFLALFSLDVFDGAYGFWGTALALFMHNIPSLILLAVLIISWRKEIIVGIIFILAGLFYIGLLFLNSRFEWYMISWMITIAGPAILVGVLFIINWLKRKK